MIQRRAFLKRLAGGAAALMGVPVRRLAPILNTVTRKPQPGEILVTQELLNDSQIDLSAYISERVAREFEAYLTREVWTVKGTCTTGVHVGGGPRPLSDHRLIYRPLVKTGIPA